MRPFGASVAMRVTLADMAESRSQREEALALAQELLTDIELSRISAVNIARKTSRLARLLDDAVSWIQLAENEELLASENRASIHIF